MSLFLYTLLPPKTVGVRSGSEWRGQNLLSTGFSTRQTLWIVVQKKVRAGKVFAWSICSMDSLGKRNLGSMPQGDEWEGKLIQLFTKLTHRPNSTTSAFPDTFESVSICCPIALGSNMGSKMESDYSSQSGRQLLCSPCCLLSNSHIVPHYPCQAVIKGFGQQMKTVPTAAYCMGLATWSDPSWEQPENRLFRSTTLPWPLKWEGK